MPRPASPASPSNSARWPTLPISWIWWLILGCSLIAYWPALTGGLLWDDSGHITRADLRSLDGLRRIWFEIGATQQYYPLLHSAFWLEHRLWGDATLGYHLVNLLQHVTAACLFGALLRRLAVPGSPRQSEAEAGATLAALLFAIHPVCVESVAWISEQKNTLSAVLYLGAALAYLRYEVERTRPRYALALVLFAAALMTKTVTATLPAALLVIFWWRRGKLGWRHDVLPLLPWFALSLGSGLLTARFEHELIGAQGAAFDLSLLERGLLAGRIAWFYLGKLLWPVDLTFIYPRWTVDASAWWQWLFPLATLAVLAAFLVLARTRSALSFRLSALDSWLSAFTSSPHARRAPLAVALLFGGTLFPVLGFFNVYPFLFSYVADHFQYLASLAVFAAAGAILTRIFQPFARGVALASGSALLLALGTLTFFQAGMYRDVFTLYGTTIERNPSASLAHNNLAVAFTAAGRLTEAIPHLQRAIQLRPDYVHALTNLGDALVQLGRPQDALPHLERAVRVQPIATEAHNTLGAALLALGRTDDALQHFRQATELNPRFAPAHQNLGLALATADRPAEAIPHFARAVQLRPDYVDAELSWGIALMSTDRFTEAIPHFERALALDPASAAAHQAFARALARYGRLDQALTHFRRVVELTPQSGAAHLDLAFALRQLGRSDEAQHHFSAARQLGAQ